MKRLSEIVPLFVAVVVAALGPAVGRTAGSATPYLQLTGTIPVAGQATVASGDTATAYGSGFCGAAGCSPVTLRIGDRVAARGVDVSANGTFRAPFTVVEDPGRYTVTVSQRAADGATLEDSAPLIVAVTDVEEEGPEVSLQVLSANKGVFRTAVRPGRCCRRELVFFQRRISAGRWRSVKRVRLNRNATQRFKATLPHGLSRVRIVVPRTKARPHRVVSKPLLVRR
jgi:hypothetical protein